MRVSYISACHSYLGFEKRSKNGQVVERQRVGTGVEEQLQVRKMGML